MAPLQPPPIDTPQDGPDGLFATVWQRFFISLRAVADLWKQQPFITFQASSDLTAAQNLGLLTTGFLKATVTGAVATISSTLNEVLTGLTVDSPTLFVDSVNHRVGVGTLAPDSKLTINLNTAALPAPLSGTMLHVGQADGAVCRVMLDAFGSVPAMQLRSANGTAVLPTATLANGNLGGLAAFGYGTTGYSASNRANVNFFAANLWTDASQGAYCVIATNPTGSAAAGVERLRVADNGLVTIALEALVHGISIGLGAASIASNTAVGAQTLAVNTTGFQNTGVGYQTLQVNTIGNNNVAVGASALTANDQGEGNVAIGSQALLVETDASQNTAVGFQALKANILGDNNTAIGGFALLTATGSSNTAVGVNAGRLINSGVNNSLLGVNAFAAATTAGESVAVGVNAAQATTTGTNNTAVGVNALFTNVSGNRNVAIGHSAGRYTTASDEFYIDNQDRTNTAGDKAGALLYGTFNSTPANQTLKINASVGVGINSTAVLTLKAGAAAASSAPLKLTSGTLLTTPEAGAIEFLTDTYYGTNTSGPTRKQFAMIDAASVGAAGEIAKIDSTGLTANVGAATLYTVPATGEGFYRVNAYVVETVAGSVSSVLPNVQILYTDKDSNVAVTIDATPILGAAGLGQTGALNANTGGTVSSGVIVIYVKASTTIQYQTSNYASVAAGMTYALRIRLELM